MNKNRTSKFELADQPHEIKEFYHFLPAEFAVLSPRFNAMANNPLSTERDGMQLVKHEFQEHARIFQASRLAEVTDARQRAALQLCCGIDLGQMEQATAEDRTGFVRRIERAIERERLKGNRRHWSYDLNRHIALKQALDRFRQAAGPAKNPQPSKNPRRRRDSR